MADENPKPFLDVMEERRAQADRFAWAVPTLVVAVQGLLLTIAVDPDRSEWGSFIAALAALGTVLAAWHQFEKQAFHFALYEAVIKRERDRLKLERTDRDSLVAKATSLEERFRREWLALRVSKPDGSVYFEPKWFLRIRARIVWRVIFALLVLVDIVVTLWALHSLVDPGWFEDESRRPWWQDG